MILSLGAGSVAEAQEFQWEGFYQARGRVFDTLSLDRTLPDNEGTTWRLQHRFWLRPKFYASEKVALMADFRGLDNTSFGDRLVPWHDPLTGEPRPAPLSNDVASPFRDGEPSSALLGFQLWRAWGEAHTDIGTFRFGRQPLHWGLGIWQNDGLGLNMEYGDSADRISWEHLIQNQIWIRLAFDAYGRTLLVGDDSDIAANVAAAWRTERMEVGLQAQYRRTGTGTGSRFDLFTLDTTFDLRLGVIGLQGEFIGQFGRGDLPGGRNDVRLTSVGGVLDASLNLAKVEVHLEAGLATGDQDPTDERIRTFSFHRDYNVGLFLFEQPMPTLRSAAPSPDNRGRSFEPVQSGISVSNALFIKPRVAYRVHPHFWLDGALLTARTARIPQAMQEADRRGYGYELHLGGRYVGLEKLELGGFIAGFVPGSYFRNFQTDVYGGFRAPAIGGQLITRVKF